MTKMGMVIGGTPVTTTVPRDTNTTISVLTLSPGTWIIMANVWMPEIMMVSLEIQGIMGVTGQFYHPQVCGIINTSTQTEYKITCTQWEKDIANLLSPYVLAVRIV